MMLTWRPASCSASRSPVTMKVCLPLGLRLPGQRREDVVGLEAGHRQVDESEGFRKLGQKRPLLREQIRHGLALGLVVLELAVPERLLRRIPGDDHRPRVVVREDLDDHRAEAVEGVGGEAFGGGDLLRQSEEGPVGDVVPVEQEERAPLGRGHGADRLHLSSFLSGGQIHCNRVSSPVCETS